MNKKFNWQQLQTLVHALSWNDAFGCYTRAGFEKLVWDEIKDRARWVIFFDIDDMGALNAEHGYEGVNQIIHDSLKLREGDYLAGQWYSGDEFIIVITDSDERSDSSPIKFCLRLSDIFKANGAPATFSVAPIVSDNLMENVAPAHQLVQRAKAEGRRGTINIVAGDPR